MTTPSQTHHLNYLRECITLAKKSPPKPTNFRVGCVIVSYTASVPEGQIISSGYTLELAGNTHAEQCALSKLLAQRGLPDTTENTSKLFPATETHGTVVVLYTSLEPCGKRLSGNLPCVQRIIASKGSEGTGGIGKVVFGAKEPGTFVKDSQSCRLLTEAGVEWDYLPHLEEEILQVAMEGHVNPESKESQKDEDTKRHGGGGTEERKGEQEQGPQGIQLQESSAPRNPKKRMMEAPPESGESQS